MLCEYPNFVPVSLDMRQQVCDVILKTKSGISAFSFANIYLFRNKYSYKICSLKDSLVIAGTKSSKTFFSVLGDIPSRGALEELLKGHDYWKGASEEQFGRFGGGAALQEDRDNFEYLYLRSDLAELPGKSFQKKRNLVNAFAKLYSGEAKQRSLDSNTLKDALHVLDEWKRIKGLSGDYSSAREALELHGELGLSGLVFYVRGAPAGYCQGEALADGKSFAVHFEKAIDEYKGIYQYINQEFAKAMPPGAVYINREQDLGDEGLRQAKMTYRPAGFVKLFSSSISTKAE